MKGIILENAFFYTPSSKYQGQRLKEEFSALGVETEIVKNDFFGGEFEGGKFKNIKKADFCVYLDKDKYCARAMESCGVRLFNSRKSIELCDDKATTGLFLADKGVPMPKTVPGLLRYDESAQINECEYDFLERELGYPMIIKRSYGSLGKFVYKADNRAELKKIYGEVKCMPHLFQQFIKESAGRDMRVIVIGGKTAAVMERISGGDFRSNVELGGKGVAAEADPALKSIAERAATLLGLDYCGADVLISDEGYLLCEVNSNAFFGGIERATGVNVARLYAEHIIKTLTKSR